MTTTQHEIEERPQPAFTVLEQGRLARFFDRWDALPRFRVLPDEEGGDE